MKIGEAAFAKVVAAVKENFGLGLEMDEYDWEEATRGILAALPSAEPGRGRVASLTRALGALVDADVCYSDRDIVIRCMCPNEAMHKVLEARLALAKARAEPVEVEGSVEGVGRVTEQELARLDQIIAKVERIERQLRDISWVVMGVLAGTFIYFVLSAAAILWP